jgi:putative ABC transport system permease protein
VDDGYFKTFGMEIVEGRAYSKEYSTDPTKALMVNEAAVKAMRMESPLGKRVSSGNNHANIIGVVKDYHFRSLHQKIEPLILIYSPPNCRVLFARLKSDKIAETVGFIEKVWKKFAQGNPFQYRFLDDALDDMYRAEQRIGKIFKYFSILAILISCLGLFGLASFMAEQRTKEIGIRKVLGASVFSIILLLSREFSKWVLAANIIAWPLAYYAMFKWLQNFAYTTDMGLFPFLTAAVLALTIALFTVSFQAFKAARANPVDSLKYE